MDHPLRIEDYGIVGNMRSAALVGTDGSIDWLCYPRFDSPSVFGRILDRERGGHFQIRPLSPDVACKQFYWPETNVLVTRFLAPEGIAELVDTMPISRPMDDEGYPLVRQLRVLRGTLAFRIECAPAFDYAREPARVRVGEFGAVFESSKLCLGLSTEIPLECAGEGAVAEFQLGEGESTSFCLQAAEPGAEAARPLSSDEANEAFDETVRYWRQWLSQCTYRGRWREQVQRSALALKLMTYEPTGAIVAAPTCALPEELGGERNWDYRYTWIRDAGFTLYALLRIGFTDEAAAFMHWLEERCHDRNDDGSLQIMYGIDGRKALPESTLDHLAGYADSRPVRIGNGAYDQLQLDIYGALMDAVYLYNKYGTPISYDLWVELRRLVNWVCDNWQRCDEGIWEVRGGQKHFVYSKLMCWVAVDRGIRLADKRSFPAERERWLRERDRIFEEIMEKGWSESRQAFVQSYGSEALDASNLIMPLVFFLSPTDPRMLATLDAINASPRQGGLVEDSLVYRYDPDETDDGLEGREGSFNLCTFWLVEALTRAGGEDPSRLESARFMFEKMLGYANHLGLYAEETGAAGEALGNFPQAFTHIALISAAHNLDRALGR